MPDPIPATVPLAPAADPAAVAAPTAEHTAPAEPTGSSEQAAAESLFVSTVRLARRLRQLTDARLTPSQHSVMMSIHRHGPLTLGELADHERVAQPTISRVVAKLEADGLVERRPDATDGRVVRVVTTAHGSELLDVARSRKVAWIDRRLAQLTDDERALVVAALPALERLQELA